MQTCICAPEREDSGTKEEAPSTVGLSPPRCTLCPCVHTERGGPARVIREGWEPNDPLGQCKVCRERGRESGRRRKGGDYPSLQPLVAVPRTSP